MTEAEWLDSTDPFEMLQLLHFSCKEPRKLALFAISSCPIIWHRLDEQSRKMAIDAEQNEDINWTEAETGKIFERDLLRQEFGVFCLRELQRYSFERLVTNLDFPAQVVDFVRDIFGNPFHPVAFSTAWRTGTAITLARQMYQSRDFSAMPILADSLEDSGCNNEDIVNHCRRPTQHVRGCWVVDHILSKS